MPGVRARARTPPVTDRWTPSASLSFDSNSPEHQYFLSVAKNLCQRCICWREMCDYMFTYWHFQFGEKFDTTQKSEGFWPTQRVLPALATCCVCPRNAFRRRKFRFHREKPKFWSIDYQAVLIFGFWILNCGAPWRTESNRSSRRFPRGRFAGTGAVW